MKPDYKGTKKHVLKLLKTDLDKNLHFHGYNHTPDVLEAVERLAVMEGINADEEILMLRTGALYHDTGFLYQSKGHEAISIEIAREKLPRFYYTPTQIETIAGIIQATQLPQNPKNHLEQIICDADLDNLGREDFYVKTHLLRLELAEKGIVKTPLEWYRGLIPFLENHNYFTESAKKLRQAKKEQHIKELKELVRE